MAGDVHVVTGAFGFSGRYIAARLLARGCQVRTLTDSTVRANPFGERVKAHPFHFHDPANLVESLRGARVLYNTYWVRFNHQGFHHSEAVENTETLFRAAKEAGVERIVHVSITKPSADSALEYFRGKARLEKSLSESGVSHAILRPTVLFGKEDILVNNIAWALRRLPLFGVFGEGRYELQPIFVDDLAALAVEEGRSRVDRVVDATGPETFTYRELVLTLGAILGKRRPIVSVPPRMGYWAASLLGLWVGDVVITREEIQGLMQGLLATDSPPVGKTRLTEWARDNVGDLGRRYASELARRRNRTKSYEQL